MFLARDDRSASDAAHTDAQMFTRKSTRTHTHTRVGAQRQFGIGLLWHDNRIPNLILHTTIDR